MEFGGERIARRGIVVVTVTRLYPTNRMPFGRRDLAEEEKEGEKFFAFLGVETLAQARELDAVYIRDKWLQYQRFWGTVIDGSFCIGSPFSEATVWRRR